MFARKNMESAEDLVNQAGPMLRHASERASEMAHQGMDSVVDTSIRLRDNAVRAADGTVKYIKSEPIKAVFIAAGVGAAVMALVSFFSNRRSGSRH